MKQCQSCGMPLQTKKAGDCRGSEKDGSKSDKWCKLCYENGGFTGPDCTLEDMKKIVDNALKESGLKESGSNKIFRWMAQKQLPKLERWRTRA